MAHQWVARIGLAYAGLTREQADVDVRGQRHSRCDPEHHPGHGADERRGARGGMDGEERGRDHEPVDRGGIVESQLQRDEPALRMAEQEHGHGGVSAADLRERGPDVGHVVADVVHVDAAALTPAMPAVVDGVHGEARRRPGRRRWRRTGRSARPGRAR